ncbi:MAG: alpha-amylase [Candidatus Lokiarchaeota archaeon]|nr:alpha-amylase [Candidatus Lokiarchaeota archaeon]
MTAAKPVKPAKKGKGPAKATAKPASLAAEPANPAGPAMGPRIYNLFPRILGSVDTWADKHLDRIKMMGFDWVYVNPLNYTGFSGSLYSIKEFYKFNPLFAPEGIDDPHSWEPLRAFIRSSHERGLKFMYDLVINHTSIDSPLVEEHRNWYVIKSVVVRKSDGKVILQNPIDEPASTRHFNEKNYTIEERVAHPCAIDPADSRKVTIWGDLAEIDNRSSPDKANMLAYWLDLVSFYLEMGMDGFRCDAAYQVPAETWRSIIQLARVQKPGTVFAAETLGCTLAQLKETVDAGFDYIFNSSKYWDFTQPWCHEQYESFRKAAPSISFPESHDTKRLADETNKREDVQRFRYLFAAFFSAGVMMPVGYEFGFTRPLDVVTASKADWQVPNFDISEFVGRVNAFKQRFRCLNEDGPMKHFDYGNKSVLVLRKTSKDGKQHLLLVYNKDWNNTQDVIFDSVPFFLDLGTPVQFVGLDGEEKALESTSWRATLEPNGHVLLLQKQRPQETMPEETGKVTEPQDPSGS